MIDLCRETFIFMLQLLHFTFESFIGLFQSFHLSNFLLLYGGIGCHSRSHDTADIDGRIGFQTHCGNRSGKGHGRSTGDGTFFERVLFHFLQWWRFIVGTILRTIQQGSAFARFHVVIALVCRHGGGIKREKSERIRRDQGGGGCSPRYLLLLSAFRFIDKRKQICQKERWGGGGLSRHHDEENLFLTRHFIAILTLPSSISIHSLYFKK